ncbi:hypothetical protein [Cytobacillus firmus]|uniref:hypothetical protein n=1 Tax=Cytobacillus firmus TaxID=1399 RepID=UPI0021620151|nr:hypothetical protein [Cytobacillus firmus]MCS0673753.1 hypothetical protein [Cytobacillus firmus]
MNPLFIYQLKKWGYLYPNRAAKRLTAACSVRTRRAFGQQWPNRCSRCPNQAGIRTAKVKSQVVVSESGTHSDRKGQIAGGGVRIWHAFGQERTNRRPRCPNQAHIGQ